MMPSVSLGAKPGARQVSYGKEKGVLCAQGPVSRRRGVKQGVSPTEYAQEDFRNNLSLG